MVKLLLFSQKGEASDEVELRQRVVHRADGYRAHPESVLKHVDLRTSYCSRRMPHGR